VRAYAPGVWESFRRLVDVFHGTLAWSSTDFNLAPRGEVFGLCQVSPTRRSRS
jgi:hypothetical protein